MFISRNNVSTIKHSTTRMSNMKHVVLTKRCVTVSSHLTVSSVVTQESKGIRDICRRRQGIKDTEQQN